MNGLIMLNAGKGIQIRESRLEIISFIIYNISGATKMERLIKVLDSVDTETIKSEVEGKKIKNSPTLNKALKKEYTNFKDPNSKKLLFRIWSFTIAQASK